MITFKAIKHGESLCRNSCRLYGESHLGDPTHAIASMGDKDPNLGIQHMQLPLWAAKIPSWGSIACNFLHGRQGSHFGDPTHVISSMGSKDPILRIQHM